jgi:hypothetical protein
MKQVGVLPLRAEYDFRAALSEHDRSRLAYSAARARDDDDLVFNSLHKILFQNCVLFRPYL